MECVSIIFCVLQYTIIAGATNVAILSQHVSAHHVLDEIDIPGRPVRLPLVRLAVTPLLWR